MDSQRSKDTKYNVDILKKIQLSDLSILKIIQFFCITESVRLVC